MTTVYDMKMCLVLAAIFFLAPVISGTNEPIVGTDDNFPQILRDAGEALVVINFGTQSCEACRVRDSIIGELATEFPSVLFVNFNIDGNQRIPSRYTRTLPSILMVKNAAEVGTLFGAAPKTDLVSLIRGQL